MDLVNNLDRLAEDQARVLNHVKEKAASADKKALSSAVCQYGGVQARKFFAKNLPDATLQYAV